MSAGIEAWPRAKFNTRSVAWVADSPQPASPSALALRGSRRMVQRPRSCGCSGFARSSGRGRDPDSHWRSTCHRRAGSTFISISSRRSSPRRCTRPAPGRRSAAFPTGRPQLALEVMDAHGIEVALTSLAQPGVGFGTRGERAGAGAALQRIRLRPGRALAQALRRARPPCRCGTLRGALDEIALRARRAQARRRLAVRELRREIPGRSVLRSGAGIARRARRGGVRPSAAASVEQEPRPAVAGLHDGIPVRHHARRGEPDLLRRARPLPAHPIHPAARRRGDAVFRLAALGLADDRQAAAAALARRGARRVCGSSGTTTRSRRAT